MINKIRQYIVDNKLDEGIIIMVLTILIYNEILIWERVKIFFIVLWIIWIYQKMNIKFTNYIVIPLKDKCKYYEKNLEKKEEKEYSELIKKYKKILKIFIFLSKIKNKFTFMNYIIKLEWKLFIFFNWINYKLINYLLIRQIIYIIIIGFFIFPIHIILFFIYNFLYKLLRYTITELILKRIIGLIISVILTSKIIDIFIYYIKYYNINIFLFIYLFLIIISIILILLEFTKYGEKIINWKDNLRIDIMDINRDKRKYVAKIDYIIWRLVEILYKDMQEITKEEIKELDFVTCITEFTGSQWKWTNWWADILFFEMIAMTLISIKRTMKIIKYKPYLFLYQIIIFFLIHSYNNHLQEIIWGLIKYKNDKEKYEKLLKFFYYIIEKEKYTVFKMWDILKYYGAKKNYFYLEYEEDDDNLTISDEYFEKVYKYKIKFLSEWNIEINKEKFLDFIDNYELYKKIFEKIYLNCFNNYYQNNNEKINLYEKFEEWEIDSSELIGYVYTKSTEDYLKSINLSSNNKDVWKVLNIFRKEINKITEELRGEWEKEWEEGKRSYIWKD